MRDGTIELEIIDSGMGDAEVEEIVCQFRESGVRALVAALEAGDMDELEDILDVVEDELGFDCADALRNMARYEWIDDSVDPLWPGALPMADALARFLAAGETEIQLATGDESELGAPTMHVTATYYPIALEELDREDYGEVAAGRRSRTGYIRQALEKRERGRRSAGSRRSSNRSAGGRRGSVVGTSWTSAPDYQRYGHRGGYSEYYPLYAIGRTAPLLSPTEQTRPYPIPGYKPQAFKKRRSAGARRAYRRRYQ